LLFFSFSILLLMLIPFPSSIKNRFPIDSRCGAFDYTCYCGSFIMVVEGQTQNENNNRTNVYYT
jgi:hypothetical protein